MWVEKSKPGRAPASEVMSDTQGRNGEGVGEPDQPEPVKRETSSDAE